MIEVLRRSPAGSGCALVATVPTVDAGRDLVKGDCEGVLLRDEDGTMHPAELPDVPGCRRGWTGLRGGIACLFIHIAQEMLDTADDALLAEGAEHVAQWEATRRDRRVRHRIQVMHRDPGRTCPVCGKPVEVVKHARPGRLREHCSDKCAATARQRRRRETCHAFGGSHTVERGQRTVPVLSCPDTVAIAHTIGGNHA